MTERRRRTRRARRQASRSGQGGAWRWVARRLGAAAAGSLLATILIAGMLLARLAAGPVSVGPLAEEIAARISAEIPGHEISVEGVTLRLGGGGLPPGIELEALSLRDDAGRELIHAPRASVLLHPGALLRGRIAPSRIALQGVSLRLAHGQAEELLQAFGGAGDDAQNGAQNGVGGPTLGALLAGGEAAGALGRLDRVFFTDLSIEIAADAAPLRIEGVSVSAIRNAAGLRLAVSARAAQAAAPWLDALATLPPGAEEAAFRVALDRGDGPSLAALAREFDGLGAVEAPISGELSGRARLDGALRSLRAVLEIGPGRIRGAEGPGGRIDAARAEFTLSPAEDRLRLESLSLRGGLGRLEAEGAGTALRGPAGRVAGAHLALLITRLDLETAAGFAAPLSFGPGRVEGDFARDGQALRLSEARIEGAGVALAASGEAQLAQDGWRGRIAARATQPILSAALAPAWPVALAAGARRWVALNLLDGQVDSLDFQMDFDPAGQEGALRFTFSDAVATPVQGLPPLEVAQGTGEVLLPRGGPAGFSITAGTAQVRPSETAAVDLSGSRFEIPDAEAEVPIGIAYVAADGALRDILSVIDRPPLRLISRLGADLGVERGGGAASARIEIPLLADLAIEDVGVEAEAVLHDLAFIIPGLGKRAIARSATLTASVSQLSLTADGAVEGAPVQAEWTEVFSPPAGQPPTRIVARGPLGAPALAAFGAPPDLIASGAGRLRAQITVPRSGPARVVADADLTGAALRLPAPLPLKPEGAEAALHATLDLGARVEGSVAYTAPGAEIDGRIAVDGRSGTLASAAFDRLRIAGMVDAAARYAAGAPATLRLDGALLDLGALLDGPETGGGGAAGGLELSAGIARLIAPGGIELRAVEAAASLGAGGAVDGRLSGRTATGAPIEAGYRRAAGAARGDLELRSSDAGAALRALLGFEAGRGGALNVAATLGTGGEAAGEVTIRDMSLRGDDPLTEGLAKASLVARDDAGVSNLRFDLIEAEFALSPSRLHLEDAMARGPQLGLTLRGDWKRGADQLDMRGVATPAYAVNGVLNRVPILGDLLGGDGEGIIGVSFAVEGASTAPEVSINPLSALTPGVLRRLFDIGADAPGPGPPRTPDR